MYFGISNSGKAFILDYQKLHRDVINAEGENGDSIDSHNQ